MPKNCRGGKKHKRNKNNNIENKALRMKEDGQEYAKIIRCKGNCRFDVICCDGKERAAILCGAMRKRRYVNQDDFVLVSLRDFQDDICDIIDLYDEYQVRTLKQDKHIPDSFKIEEENPYDSYDDGIDFVNDMPPDEEELEDGSEDSVNLDDI